MNLKNKTVIKRLFGYKKKKTGLALGGGAVLGAAHIGVLRAFEEFNISVDCIAGTSVGAFVGALHAFNKGWKEIEEISKNLKWVNVSEVSLSKYGLLGNEKIGDLLKEHIGDRNIEEANIPLHIVTTDITTGEKVILSKGNLINAVRASAAIPGIFIPVEIDGRLLVDGGVIEHVPLSPLKASGASRIIGVELLSRDVTRKPANTIEILINTFEFMVSNITKAQEEEFDILIRPDLSSFDKFNTRQISELTQKGYDTAKKIFSAQK